MRCGRGTALGLEPRMMAFLLHPAGEISLEQSLDSAPERSVTLLCDRQFLQGVIDHPPANFPARLQKYLTGQDVEAWTACGPMSPRTCEMAETLLSPPYPGPLARLAAEAKATELLCVALSRLCEGLDGPAAPFRAREYKKVHEICDLFQRDLRCVITVAELARRVTWNESRMMACFKEITGETIFGYRQRLRLERALNQLRATNSPITQVASDAGYSHPANFATAFKRRFGYTPHRTRGAGFRP
jgi:AraC-like DNA-binding protein